MKLIDTHCHLSSSSFSLIEQEVINDAIQAGVYKIIDVAYNEETLKSCVLRQKKYNNLYIAVGLCPHDANSYSDNIMQKIKNIALTENKNIAIGEIGLDNYYKISSIDKQIECFRHQLQMAEELNLPVLVHMRESFNEIIESLKEENFTKGGIIHCFTGSKEQAKKFLDLGFYLSFSGILTFAKTGKVAESAKYIPLDKLLIETDAPYLSPIPERGKINKPSYLIHTAKFLADLRDNDYEILAEQLLQNTYTLFPKMKA